MKIPDIPLWGVRLGIGVALLSATLWVKSCYDGEIERRAAIEHTADSLRVTLKAQQKAADSLVKAFRVDTVRVTQTVTRWRTLRDTLTFSDTVRLTVRESVIVAAADTAVAQCTRTLDTCEAIVAAKDSQLVTLRAQIMNEARRQPGFFRRTAKGMQWLGAGVILGLVIR